MKVHIWLALGTLSDCPGLTGYLYQQNAPVSVDTGLSRGSQPVVDFLRPINLCCIDIFRLHLSKCASVASQNGWGRSWESNAVVQENGHELSQKHQVKACHQRLKRLPGKEKRSARRRPVVETSVISASFPILLSQCSWPACEMQLLARFRWQSPMSSRA